MKILRVVGLGLAIVMLKFLVPRIFLGIENVLLTFFDTLGSIFSQVNPSVDSGAASIEATPFLHSK
jgi:hypothetical protein